MDWIRHQFQRKRHDHQSWWGIPIRRNISRTIALKCDKHSANHKYRIRHRNYLGLLAVALLYGGSAAAQTSSTAAPVANSSGSVTNMGIQNLPGNSVTNHYGGSIICQGPMLTFSPFLTDSHTYSLPKEYWYDAPSYNDDGTLSHHVATRTGQKDNHALNMGFSINFSIPLDNSLQRRCKTAVDKQLDIQQELINFKRLDFEITRLKNCGELMLKGIEFAADSPYRNICKDVVVKPKMGQVLPHRHTLKPLEVVSPSSLDKR